MTSATGVPTTVPSMCLAMARENGPGEFRSIVRSLLARSDASHTMFLVDDAVFVRDFDLGTAVRVLTDHPRAACFHLKLGAHVWYCHPANTLLRPPRLPLLGIESEIGSSCPRAHGLRWDDAVIAFSLHESSGDWNYPWDMCGTVYRTPQAATMLDCIEAKHGGDTGEQRCSSAIAWPARM